MSDEMLDLSIEKYDIQKQWLEKIAPKYLDMDNINHLKVGLFGYLNEIMATELRQDIAHRNFLYDETFLNTASMAKSIYNKAKSYNYEISLAKPASCTILFSIKQESILEFGERLTDSHGYYTGEYRFKIDKDNEFFMGQYSFMIESNIYITATKLSSGSYSYTARYDFSDTRNLKGRFSGENNPYISTWVDRDKDLGDIVTLRINIYQVSKSSTLYENYSSDLSDNLFFDTKYKNNLCDFQVEYTSFNETTILGTYFNDTFTPTEDKYCYYSFDNNVLTTYFSGLPAQFKPAINSKLKVIIYSTLGSEGNINFEGNVRYDFSNYNSDIDYVISILVQPTGGNNMPSKTEIKQDLMYEFLTRDNLITEFDLNNYFNKLIKEEVVNASSMLFIKKRDDVLKRCYAVYLLLKDPRGYIIPTNTIDLTFLLNINKNHSVPAGQTIVYDDNEYVLWNDTAKSLITNFSGKFYRFGTDIDNVYIPYDSRYDEFKDQLTIHSNGFYKIFKERNVGEDSYTLTEYVPINEELLRILLNLPSKDSPEYNPYNDININDLTLNDKISILDGRTIYSFKDDLELYVIYSEDLLVYDTILRPFVVNKRDFRADNKTDDINNYKLSYILPFSIYYFKEAPQRAIFVRNSIDRDYYYNYNFVNSNIPAEFIMSPMNVKRDSISFNTCEESESEVDPLEKTTTTISTSSDGTRRILNKKIYDENDRLIYDKDLIYREIDEIHEYKLEFSLDTTYNKDLVVGNEKAGINKEVICRCLIKNNKGIYNGYFDFDCETDNKKIIYSAKLVTNDEINYSRKLMLIDCIKDVHKEQVDGTDINIGDTFPKYELDPKCTFEIVFLVKDDKYDPILPDCLANMPDLKGYTVATKLENTVPISLFTIVNDVINPVLQFRTQYTTYDNDGLVAEEDFINKGFNLLGIPVLGRHYFNNYNVYKEFFELFEIYYDVLLENFDKLENNTNIDMKFYNTYGRSKHYSSYSTDITLQLTIKLANETYTTDLDLKIKKAIIDFVNETNNNTNQIFAISNLIRTLERTFPDIKYIEFENIDGLDVQKITKDYPEIKDLTKEQLINYIPEYLNIHIGAEAYAKGEDDFVTGITIKYK